MRKRIFLRDEQLRRIHRAVDIIVKHRRADRQAAARRKAIYRHVAGHLEEVRQQCVKKEEENRRAEDVLAQLAECEGELEGLIQREAKRAGIDATEASEVERAVNMLLKSEGCEEEDESGSSPYLPDTSD